MASASGDNARTKEDTLVKKRKDKHKSEDEDVSINLTDPNDVLDKLAALELGDDETEELLKRAYEVNRELKKQLELGRLMMDQRMTSSSSHPNDRTPVNKQRPGSNKISLNMPNDHGLTREPTRMASATHSGHSRRSANTGLGSVVSKNDHPMQNYSYHSYVS